MSHYVQQLSFLQLPNKNPETGFGPACGRPLSQISQPGEVHLILSDCPKSAT